MCELSGKYITVRDLEKLLNSIQNKDTLVVCNYNWKTGYKGFNSITYVEDSTFSSDGEDLLSFNFS